MVREGELMNPVEIKMPDTSVESGIPFVLEVTSTQDPLPEDIRFDPVEAAGATPFLAPVRPVGEHRGLSEVVIEIPGKYAMIVRDYKRTMEVQPRTDLDFGTEFGIFALAVSLLVGGMVVWLIKKRPH